MNESLRRLRDTVVGRNRDREVQVEADGTVREFRPRASGRVGRTCGQADEAQPPHVRGGVGARR